MTQFPDPNIISQPAQHVAAVRRRVSMAELRDHYDESFPKIFMALARGGVHPAGAAMGITHEMTEGELDLSVAVPVEEPFSDDGEVRGFTLPASPTVTLLIRGDYSLIADAYSHLFAWIDAQGGSPTGLVWEQYLTEPQPGGDPSLNETLLGVQVEGLSAG